ncbi:MBL fold metallo-hydrolase [Candidatus Woesearchaeota archaeon]|nr:MBL fold metallo-hydrolase [Candidatus Woesearchaeota archaeon]
MKEIIWHGHATIQLNSQEKNVVIYIDPYNLSDKNNNLDNNKLNNNFDNNLDKADIILITHAHYDHCSLADAIKVSKPTTIILSTADCLKNLEKLDVNKKVIVEPNKKYDVNGIIVETIPAYNINTKFHPKEKKWVGYVITINNKKYYHAGDTDEIPEMSAFKETTLSNIDVAFLPIGGTYTMNAEEAVKAANAFNPKKVIPIHYGNVVGTKEDAELFKEKCNCDVEILEEN